MNTEQQNVLTEEQRLNKAADRLEGVFYQFSEVHKTVISQEQIIAKHMGETEELAKTLKQHVDQLGYL